MKRALVALLLAGCGGSTVAPTAPADTASATRPAKPVHVAPPRPTPTPTASGGGGGGPAGSSTSSPEAAMQNDVYSLTANALDGSTVDLSKYRGKVALIVNVASECGYTPQYAGLQKLWKEYQEKGVVVLGFPSNEFGGQEPGSAEQIGDFCATNYGVSFPMMAKIETKKGPGQSPVYAALTAATGKEPNWNFCKYLVGKSGRVLQFWNSKTTPEAAELRTAIDAALGAK